MRRLFLSAVTLSASLAMAAAAPAQQPAQAAPEAQEPEIVVEGVPLTPKVVNRYISRIASATEGQFTRFDGPVCPVVIGLPPEYAHVVEKRILRLAGEVGAEVGGTGCNVSLVLIVASDADALVAEIRKQLPDAFRDVSDTEQRRAFRSGPVHMWNSVVLFNEDGQPATSRGGIKVLDVKSASILRLPSQRTIVGSTFVIDDDALIGKSLSQVADYVAMRALSGALPPKERLDTKSILTLFDPSVSAPPAATELDRSYLRALYRMSPLERSTTAISRLSQLIRADAAARGAPPPAP